MGVLLARVYEGRLVGPSLMAWGIGLVLSLLSLLSSSLLLLLLLYYDYTVSFFVFFQFVSPLCFLIFPFFFLLRIRGHLLYVWISIWIYIYVYIFPHIKYINIYYIYIFLFHVCMVLSFSDEYDSYMYIYILLYLLIIRLFVRLFFLVSTAPFFYPFFLMLCTLSISAYRSAPRCVVIDIRQLANG